MCGIAGFSGRGDKSTLFNMMGELRHRGPDDEGIYIDSEVHLGHKRLSIIDLSEKGRQPMSNEDASVWIVFNGEIYNFRELKDFLISRGHRFSSETDSEVIIHLYEDCGSEAFVKLNGMFGFAIWDRKKSKIYLVRDRMGQKPLYYAINDGTLIFASEARSLIKHPSMIKRPELTSIVKFLFYEHVPTPDCIWENAAKLTPASFLEFDTATRSHRIESYWKISFLPRTGLSEQECVEQLESKLTASVRRHLIADVPVGVYLSGGMDSTTVAYYCREILGSGLKTFTVAFDEPTFDEQYRARETAEALGTEHHEFTFTPEIFMDTALKIIPALDEPFADSSLVPSYYLNKYARAHIKVALGGEGGDEIFVGYPIFRAHELLKYLKVVPSVIRNNLLIPLISGIRSSYENETWEYRLKKFVEADGYLQNPFYCQQIWLGAFGPKHLPKLFKKGVLSEEAMRTLFSNIDLYRRDADENETLIDGLMRQTQHKYLMDDGLTKTDRASMYNSLEMRAPLLDAELVEWVNRVPFHYKYRHGTTKLLIRKLMQDKLPKNILTGRKRGFTPPIAEWFVKYFQKQIKEYIFLEDDLFNVNYIEKLWDEHFSRKQNHRKLLWTFFVWKLWSSKNIN